MVQLRSDLDDFDLAAFRQAMRELRALFDGTDFDEFDYPCIEEIAAPIASSLAKYQEALAIWEACETDGSCTATAPSSAVTDVFVDASDRLDEALAGLARGGA